MTPVFYSLEPGARALPAGARRSTRCATLIESYRAVLIGTPSPGAAEIAGRRRVRAVLAAAAACSLFRRLEPGFVDEL